MPEQRVLGGSDPYVVARDGTRIPVPREVPRPDGSGSITITGDAVAVVTGSSDTHYYVEIRIPGMSGDARMVLAATGFGTARGTANAYLRQRGWTYAIRWGAARVIGGIFAAVIGVFVPNEPAAQIFIRRQLENGARVIYVIIA